MSIVEPIFAVARRSPAAAAIFAPGLELSFAQLADAVRRGAGMLSGLGLQQGDRVGISVADPVLHLVACLALGRIGAAHLGLPPRDPPGMRRQVAQRLGLAAVIVAPGAREDMGAPAIAAQRQQMLEGPLPAGDSPPPCQPSLPWLILRSSGTTGEPKYAELSHADALARSRRFAPLWNYGPGDRFWSPIAIDYVVAKQRCLFSLHAGAAVCFSSGPEAGVTVACGTPYHLQVLARHDGAAAALAGLRVFEARSATVSEPLRAEFRKRCSPNLHVVYACNEAETMTLATPELQSIVPDTVGIPVAGIELEVVDASSRPLPAEEIGEVRVRGPGVIQAYLDNADATARSFRDGWFHPGDLASFTPRGALVLQGRTDDMMIFDGLNVYPAEIERTLLQNPAVAEASAFSIPSPIHQDVPAAAVVLRQPVSERELKAYCRDRIGTAAPHLVLRVAELPRNAGGKVVKRELQRLAGIALARRKA